MEKNFSFRIYQAFKYIYIFLIIIFLLLFKNNIDILKDIAIEFKLVNEKILSSQKNMEQRIHENLIEARTIYTLSKYILDRMDSLNFEIDKKYNTLKKKGENNEESNRIRKSDVP